MRKQGFGETWPTGKIFHFRSVKGRIFPDVASSVIPTSHFIRRVIRRLYASYVAFLPDCAFHLADTAYPNYF